MHATQELKSPHPPTTYIKEKGRGKREELIQLMAMIKYLQEADSTGKRLF